MTPEAMARLVAEILNTSAHGQRFEIQLMGDQIILKDHELGIFDLKCSKRGMRTNPNDGEETQVLVHYKVSKDSTICSAGVFGNITNAEGWKVNCVECLDEKHWKRCGHPKRTWCNSAACEALNGRRM